MLLVCSIHAHIRGLVVLSLLSSVTQDQAIKQEESRRGHCVAPHSPAAPAHATCSSAPHSYKGAELPLTIVFFGHRTMRKASLGSALMEGDGMFSVYVHSMLLNMASPSPSSDNRKRKSYKRDRADRKRERGAAEEPPRVLTPRRSRKKKSDTSGPMHAASRSTVKTNPPLSTSTALIDPTCDCHFTNHSHAGEPLTSTEFSSPLSTPSLAPTTATSHILPSSLSWPIYLISWQTTPTQSSSPMSSCQSFGSSFHSFDSLDSLEHLPRARPSPPCLDFLLAEPDRPQTPSELTVDAHTELFRYHSPSSVPTEPTTTSRSALYSRPIN
jgi:hypothetical protein